ncbi:MAG: nitrilase-related carbon-nitrogen hydrolase, partial [Planctomycetota bacterium]
MRIGFGQFNAVLGDLQANARRINQLYADALEHQVDLLVVPELAICGYPPEDLLLKPHFIQDNRPVLEKLATDCPKMAMVVGFPDYHQQKAYNAAALLRNSKIEKIYRKALLPNYGVFDEKRYFHPGTEPVIVTVNNIKIALTICEDIWDIQWLSDFLGKQQIDMVLNISASPFHIGRGEKRQQVVSDCAKAFGCAVGYCNLVGGQDELVFDGRSMIADNNGRIVAMAAGFKEDLLIADLSTTGQGSIEVKPLD